MNSNYTFRFLRVAQSLRGPLLVMLLFSSAAAQAKSIYVTDMLRLDMYATEAMNGPRARGGMCMCAAKAGRKAG